MMPKEEVAKKFFGTTKEDIDRIVDRHMQAKLRLKHKVEESEAATKKHNKNPTNADGLEIV